MAVKLMTVNNSNVRINNDLAVIEQSFCALQSRDDCFNCQRPEP